MVGSGAANFLMNILKNFEILSGNQQLLSRLQLVAEITVPLITVSVALMYWRRKIRIALGVGNFSDGNGNGNGIIDIELALGVGNVSDGNSNGIIELANLNN